MILRIKIKRSLVLNNKWLDYKELFKKPFFVLRYSIVLLSIISKSIYNLRRLTEWLKKNTLSLCLFKFQPQMKVYFS